jgi:hypothetical protein
MNDKRLNQLFDAARRETPAAPAEGFESLVLRQIQRHPARSELSISDLLGLWFPRLAVAAATIIAISVLSDFVSSGPSLTESAVQLSNQYFADN